MRGAGTFAPQNSKFEQLEEEACIDAPMFGQRESFGFNYLTALALEHPDNAPVAHRRKDQRQAAFFAEKTLRIG